MARSGTHPCHLAGERGGAVDRGDQLAAFDDGYGSVRHRERAGSAEAAALDLGHGCRGHALLLERPSGRNAVPRAEECANPIQRRAHRADSVSVGRVARHSRRQASVQQRGALLRHSGPDARPSVQNVAYQHRDERASDQGRQDRRLGRPARREGFMRHPIVARNDAHAQLWAVHHRALVHCRGNLLRVALRAGPNAGRASSVRR